MLFSRKLFVTIISLLLLTGGWILIGLMPSLVPSFTTYAGALVALLSVYAGANVSHHYVNSKTAALTTDPADEDTKEDSKEA